MIKLRPEVLQHPNIPKPLHGLSPRAVMGQVWWDQTRKAVYAKQDNHCIACGVHKSKAKYHQWIEAHEDYTINYSKGTMEIKEIVGLCHSCHGFIHCGRLRMLMQKREISKSKWQDIMLHGFSILKKAGLDPWYGQATSYCSGLDFLGIPIPNQLINNAFELELKQSQDKTQQDWSKWHMVFEGRKYYSKFKNMAEWEQAYN